MKELADFTGKSEIQVSQLISDWSTHLVGSLDDILAGTEDFHPFDTVAADPGCDPLEQLLAKEGDFQGVTRDVLSGVLDSLPQRHKDILELRYGHELTLSEIGKIYGLSREGVRLIEYKALRMVRARLYSGSRPIAYQQETRLKRQLGKKT
jgi:DNA-directed RNA polymerase sigma subunit (sigma70/sigma32)